MVELTLQLQPELAEPAPDCEWPQPGDEADTPRVPWPASSAVEIARASEDYLRFCSAYLKIAGDADPNEVALAMIGADLDAAFTRLQAVTRLPTLPHARPVTDILRNQARQARGMPGQQLP